MGLINIEDLTKLSVYNVRITSLNEQKRFLKDDVFIASRVNNEDNNDYSSIRLNYDLLSSQISSNTVFADLELSGNWFFSKKLTMPTRSILNQLARNNLNVAVNDEVMQLCCLQKIYDLSTEIYFKPHVPSHVGQIITTTTLATEKSVQNIFGANTEWEQIFNKFILGVGKREPNTINTLETISGFEETKSGETGGNIDGKIMLNDAQVPKHNHGKIEAETCHVKNQYCFGMDYKIVASPGPMHNMGQDSTKDVAEFVCKGTGEKGTHGVSRSVDGDTTNTKTVGSTIKIKGSLDFSSLDYVREIGNPGVDKAVFDTNMNEIKQKKFDHMPLFYYVYIWRRTK